MAHHLLTQKKMVFVSLDLETGGEICGIIQLSADIVRVELKRGGVTYAKDSLTTVQRGEGTFEECLNPEGTVFNEYVNPGKDAEWNAAGGVELHNLTASHPSIRSARGIGDV